MSTSTAIGAKVKILRIGKEMTIKQLSEACGLSVGFLSQFERGISSIAIDSLETIANVLGVPLSELFVETEDKVPTEGGCRLILIFKAPTPKQAYPADFLDFSAKNVLRDMLVFLSSPYFRAQNPLLLYL